MSLKTYLMVFQRRKMVVLMTVSFALIVTLVGTELISPTYAATASLQFNTPSRGSLEFVDHDLGYADRLMNTISEIASSTSIRDKLMKRFNLGTPPIVKAEIIANTELLKISTDAKDAMLAKNIANAVAEMLVAKSGELSQQNTQRGQEYLKQQLSQLEIDLAVARQTYDDLVAQSPNDIGKVHAAEQDLQAKRDNYKSLQDQLGELRSRQAMQSELLSVLDPAIVPLQPTKPNKQLNLMLGLFVGLIAGLGLALLFENLDSTVHSVEQIETITKLPVLGRIPLTKNMKWPAVVMNSHSGQEEAFVRLQMSLLTHVDVHTNPTLLVTSAEPGEGKSTIVANLAMTLMKAGYSVIVVDCNFHNPSLQQIFYLPTMIGLSDILQQQFALVANAQPVHAPSCRVIVAGSPYTGNAHLLTKARLLGFIGQLKSQADVILLDGPAFLSVADSIALATIADGVLMVVGETIAHQNAVQVALQELSTITPKVLGLVINRTTEGNYYHS